MLLAGIDFESSGLQIDKVSILEVGLVLWDTDLHLPVNASGFLVDPGLDAFWEPGVEKINGLSPAICSRYGIPDEKAVRQTLHWYRMADAAVAHNGPEFDRPLLRRWAKKYGLDWQPDKLWIDTKCDLEIPAHNSTRLTYMATDHGFLNPFPHRAMFDVFTMMKILDSYDINKVVEVAKSPTLKVRALVTFDERELARNRGFHSEYDNGNFVAWTMSVKKCYLERERDACRTAGFEIEVMKGKQ